MLLRDKTAIVYGATGAVGTAIAKAFAAAGAAVYVSGRRTEALDALVAQIRAAGGRAHAAEVDALDESSVQRHLAAVVAERGRLDISFNAIGIAQDGLQGIPLTEISIDAFMLPIATYAQAHFVTARSAGRAMAQRGGGVILMHTPEPARVGIPLVGGMGPAWAALEGLSRALSAELASQGVRSVCLRSTGLPETATIDLVFDLHARPMGMTRAQFLAMLEGLSHRRRLATLEELAAAAVFAASDAAAALTGTALNLTGGLAPD